MPLDTPPVYRIAETTVDIEGGTGQDLAKQVVTVIKETLDFKQEDSITLDVQYCLKFNGRSYLLINIHQPLNDILLIFND